LNNAEKNLANLKNQLTINRIKAEVAPQFYELRRYGGYSGFNRLLERRLPVSRNEEKAIRNRLKNALNAHNKKIQNAEKRVENIKNKARKHIAQLLAKTRRINHILHAPGTGMMYARAAHNFGVKLPQSHVELAKLLRQAENRGRGYRN
jgi:small-conductance mechanosensitive channel